ncbi:MAG TPA: protein kinase [Anaeromyxobacter sp.]|nr:protein kinase [Anaeromyxobacter sp.]
MPEVDPSPRPVRPGALSALLAELVRAPQAEGGWGSGPAPGEVVAGRFEILREIGRGGFGVVYEARDRDLGRLVAFKAVQAGPDSTLRGERLLREAESAASLSHPCIVTLHDVGRCEHGPYLVLELLRGRSLADRLSAGPLPLEEALRIAVKVAEGLAHAHRQGVVHRDLTPGNVFLCEDGQVKVLDFGLAHAFGQRRQDGGTPAYMAPEQWRGAPEDERTDVFALGVLLYRALSGAAPFPDDDGGRAVTGPKPAPALEVPGAPALGALVRQLLEKDPVRRPRDGGQVLAALGPLAEEAQRSPSRSGVAARPARPWRRGWTRALVAVAGAVVLLGLLAAAIHLGRRPPHRPAGPLTVAVADFQNQTGDPELDGLSGMLITSLEQSQRLAVLTRVRMLDLLRQSGRAGVEVVDEAQGREVARAAGVRALVLATIRRFDRLYAIELKVLDPERSAYLFTLQEQGEGKAAVPGMIDRLSERTRERLAAETREERAASSVKVADVTTRSFEAYQHYFRGDQLKESIRYDQAIAEYRKALAIDPDFALAHYRIAYLGEFTGMDDAERRAEMEAALRNVDRVPAKERMLFQAWQLHLDGKDDEAHALYARAAEAYPQDKEVLFLAGDLYLHQDRILDGLPYFERAVALDPFWEPARMHLTDSLGLLLRGDELYRRAKEWVDKAPSASAYRALCAAHGLAGRWDDAVDAARKAYQLDESAYSRSELHSALIMAERYGEAEALARAGTSSGASPMDRAERVEELVEALAYQGRWREAMRAVDGVSADLRDREAVVDNMRLGLLLGEADPEPALATVRRLLALPGTPEHVKMRHGLALALAWLGDAAGAAPLIGSLPVTSGHRRIVEAVVAWKSGRGDQALAELRELAQGGEAWTRPEAWAILGMVAKETGRDADVVAAAEGLRQLPLMGDWRCWAYPRALLAAAQASERLGERARARAYLDRLLLMWQRADADLPYLKEARALRRRLGEAT